MSLHSVSAFFCCGFELRGKANSATELMLAVNGDYTEGNYQASYSYGSTQQARPIVLMANGYTGYARGEIAVVHDAVLVTGIGQRGYSARDTAAFSIVKAVSSLNSIQVRCRTGQINAGVIFRVWRMM